MSKLFKAIQVLKPTIFSAVPRLYNKLFAEYQDALAGLSFLSLLFSFFSSLSLTQTQTQTHAVAKSKTDRSKWKAADKQILAQFKNTFGGRTTMLVAGGICERHKDTKRE